MIPALRKLAQCTLVALLLVFPVREFSAADALPQVNTIPRFALIIGNGKYRGVPLKNAPNDAKAMADHLTRMGFDVTLKVDASRAEMIAGFEEVIAKLGETGASEKAARAILEELGHG